MPQLTAAPQVYGAQGQCNAAYGQASGLIKQRYLYTVNLFAANGFYVVSDLSCCYYSGWGLYACQPDCCHLVLCSGWFRGAAAGVLPFCC